MSTILLFVYAIVTSLGLIFVKLGTTDGLPIKFVDNKLDFNLNAYTVGGILLYGFSFVLYMYLISKNDLGYIIPITTALVYILIFVGSYVIFHEAFTVVKVIGIALIIAGLVFLNLQK
jgi:drug/metabolite transporter (DMT)-like permease